MVNLDNIATEQRNTSTLHIDELSTIDMLRVINNEDKKVAEAVGSALPAIAAVVDETSNRIKNGGHLIYIGAGTSGRLGLLDAAECPPTFGTNPETVQGIIAGGYHAVFRAKEGAEDDPHQAEKDLKKKKISNKQLDKLLGGWSVSRVAHLRNARDRATLEEVQAIADALGVELEELQPIKIEPKASFFLVNLPFLMKSKGISGRKLAELTDIPSGTIFHYIGLRHRAPLFRVEQIAIAFYILQLLNNMFHHDSSN